MESELSDDRAVRMAARLVAAALRRMHRDADAGKTRGESDGEH